LQLISRAGKLIKGTVVRTGPAFLYNIAPKSVQSSNQRLLLARQQAKIALRKAKVEQVPV
jgi:hypothetical protein